MKNLGLQLYTIRDCMLTEKDIDESFAKLVEIGYTDFLYFCIWFINFFVPIDFEEIMIYNEEEIANYIKEDHPNFNLIDIL